MSNRHRTVAASADSTDTAVGEVEDLTLCFQAALFELSDRPGLPTRCSTVGMLVGKAGVVVENAAYPVGIVSGIGRYPPYRARLHPRCCQCHEGGRHESTLVVARLRPWIGKEHPHFVDRSRWQQVLYASGSICLDDSDIVQPLVCEVPEHSCYRRPVDL